MYSSPYNFVISFVRHINLPLLFLSPKLLQQQQQDIDEMELKAYNKKPKKATISEI